ncbi:MAG: hypothetical protein H6586_00625 [Flavobacteriales bacterium]|nr:hypothetical protein [Flavobacteriales bacterium]
MNDIQDFYNMMERGNIMLSFKGEVTSDLLTSILQIMETKMETLDEPPKIKKKVYNILVECLQNLYHHIDEDDKLTAQNEKSALFMIRKEQDGEYSIMTGNYIAQENVNNMKDRLDRINAMDKEELKDYYKEVLNNGEMSAKGGGGLGMIDIARKSGRKLEYNFAPVDDKFSFFSLNVKVAQ